MSGEHMKPNFRFSRFANGQLVGPEYPHHNVEKTLAENRSITITTHAMHTFMFDAGNWSGPVYPGLPVAIRFLNPVPGAPKLSDWLRKLADEVAKHEPK